MYMEKILNNISTITNLDIPTNEVIIPIIMHARTAIDEFTGMQLL